jgi:hypothetical protein
MLVFFVSLKSIAHEQAVHRKITENAVSYVGNNSQGYINFISTISNPNGTSLTLSDGTTDPQPPAKWMKDGSNNEDFVKAPGDLGGYRSLNHFYDP